MEPYSKCDSPAYDQVAYAHAIESVYGVAVVVELTVGKHPANPPFAIVAKAYMKSGELVTASNIQRVVCYPSRHYRSFTDALMAALYALEEGLRAKDTLDKMGWALKA